MSDKYFNFKASLQNTLNPEVGTFDNEGNKEGTFTLEDGEYYLTNETSTGYLEYQLTKSTYFTGCTVEFDVNYSYTKVFSWILGFFGDENKAHWHGIGIEGNTLQFRGSTLSNHNIVVQPNTWIHVTCIFDHYYNQNVVHIYIDGIEVTNFSISNDYYIKYLYILGNSVGFVPTGTKIKNIIIYSNNNNKHCLDTAGLTSLWSKIKSLFATKTELDSKANTSDLSNYYTKSEVDNLLSNIETQVKKDETVNP